RTRVDGARRSSSPHRRSPPRSPPRIARLPRPPPLLLRRVSSGPLSSTFTRGTERLQYIVDRRRAGTLHPAGAFAETRRPPPRRRPRSSYGSTPQRPSIPHLPK